MCDHRVVLHRCVVREWCHPSGSAGATCLQAAARTRRAARAVQGDVVSVWQVLHGTPSAPPIPAQRVARFDDHYTRNCLLKNKLRQRYSRSKRERHYVMRLMILALGCPWHKTGAKTGGREHASLTACGRLWVPVSLGLPLQAVAQAHVITQG